MPNTIAAALVCTLLGASSAQAVIIKASNYVVGTNITNAVPRVTLQIAMSDGIGGFTTAPLVIAPDAVFAGDGAAKFNTFGDTYGGQGPDDGYFDRYIPPAGYGWEAVDAVFTVPVYSVSVMGFVENGVPGVMAAYGANGEQLDVEVNNGGPLRFTPCVRGPTGGSGCLAGTEETVTSTTAISYVLFAGTNDLTYFTAIDIPGIPGSVPEPSSLALFGCGLMAVGIAILRRHRQGLESR